MIIIISSSSIIIFSSSSSISSSSSSSSSSSGNSSSSRRRRSRSSSNKPLPVRPDVARGELEDAPGPLPIENAEPRRGVQVEGRGVVRLGLRPGVQGREHVLRINSLLLVLLLVLCIT